MSAGATALRMVGLLGSLQVDPGTLSPTVDLQGVNGSDPVGTGYYQYITNVGSLGGQAVPYALTTDYMPGSDPTAFSQNSPAFQRRGGGAGGCFGMSVDNGFKPLHMTVGATMFIRCKTQSALNTIAGYGLFYSDMSGAGADIGIHLKYYLPSNGNNVLLIEACNATAGVSYGGTSADNAILADTYYTLAVHVIDGPTAGKIKVQAWINGVVACTTPEFTPNTGNASYAETIGNFVSDRGAAAHAIYQRVLVVPSATDAQIVGVHNWFVANP